VTFEWDARKAAANFTKHAIAFEEAATVFLDPFASTFPDPDHSKEERREIAIGYAMKGHLVFVSHCERRRAELNDLRPEYDLSQLKGGVRGKYYRRAAAGTNLVLIEPDLAVLFPNAEAVNRALRVLAEAAKSTTAPKRRSAR
jgi:uncharacterized DUF497 family protein